MEYAQAQLNDSALSTIDGRAVELARLQGLDNPKVFDEADKKATHAAEIEAKRTEQMTSALQRT